jgi:hypothetical protein
MTDREKAKQIGREIVEAAESYLIEFIRAVRADDPTPRSSMKPSRDRLFAAIDAAIDASEGR